MKQVRYFVIAISIILLIATAISFFALRKIIFKNDTFLIRGTKAHVVSEKIRNKLINEQGAKEFKLKSDVNLSGLYIKRDRPVGNVILCHGFQRSKEFMTPFIDFFPRHNIYMFDFRGQGQSDDDIITFGINESNDVIAASKYVKSISPNLPLIIAGVSMGGASIINAASKYPELCDAIIVEGVFKCLTTVITFSFNLHSGLPHFPFLPLMFFLARRIYNYDAYTFKPVELVSDIKIPIMFVNTCEDKIVPPEHTLDLYAKSFSAGNDPKLWITPPVPHAMASRRYPEEYKMEIKNFISGLGLPMGNQS